MKSLSSTILSGWKENPCKFVWDNFRIAPDAWQEKVLEAFVNPSLPRISMQACAGPGKTAVHAWCGWLFLSCFGEKGEHPKGLAISVTQDNLKMNLWSEYAKWQARSPYLTGAFEWTKERIYSKDHPATWFLGARSFSRKANPEEQGRTLSGLHSKYVLAQIDESGDIPTAVLKAAEQALSTCKFGKILQAGNPTSLDGMLYAAATHLSDQWFIVRITGDPDDPDRSPRIDIENARRQIATYGRDDPWVMSYILGKFPLGGINTLLGPDDVADAMKRHIPEDQYNWAQKRLGIDVARFGLDRTVIFPRQGIVAFEPMVMRQADTTKIAARVMLAKANWESEREFVDDSGHWGHGVIDNLQAAGIGATPVLFEDTAIDRRFKNRRAEMWIKMAEWIKAGGAIPYIPEFTKELTAPTYTFVNGKFVLEPKDEIKKRIGKSPDLADALALTFAEPEMPAKLRIPGYSHNRNVKSDYDPLENE